MIRAGRDRCSVGDRCVSWGPMCQLGADRSVGGRQVSWGPTGQLGRGLSGAEGEDYCLFVCFSRAEDWRRVVWLVWCVWVVLALYGYSCDVRRMTWKGTNDTELGGEAYHSIVSYASLQGKAMLPAVSNSEAHHKGPSSASLLGCSPNDMEGDE